MWGDTLILTRKAEAARQWSNSENWNEMRAFPHIFKCLLPSTKMALPPPVDTSTNKSPSSEKPAGAKGVEKGKYWGKK